MELYEADGTKTPSYILNEEIQKLKREFDVSCLIEDFELLSKTRDYVNDVPLHIKYSEIKNFVQLRQSKSLELIELNDYEVNQEDVKIFTNLISDIDNFYVYKRREQISEDRKNKSK